MGAEQQSAEYPRIGVVTGLAAEAAVVSAMLDDSTTGVRVVCAGASPARAVELSRQLVAEGAQALLSLGIAGAADPQLESGALVVAREVVTEGAERYACDPQWQEALDAALAGAQLPFCRDLVFAGSRVRSTPKDKQAVFRTTGCKIIDMESGAVGGVTAAAGLPFMAVRAVADRAADRLPDLVETAVTPDGRPDVGRAIAALVRQPFDIPATLRLARRTELALAKLRMLETVKSVLFGGFR